MHRTLPVSLAALAFLAGCPREAVETDTDDTDTPSEPGWDDQTVASRFHREGYGEAWRVAAADVDQDGNDEIFYGGRGLALLDDLSLANQVPRWELPWPAGDDVRRDGDNDWVQTLALYEADGDGVPEALVLDSRNRAFSVDGATGEVLWQIEMDLVFSAVRLAQFDANSDGVLDFFPNGGFWAYDGKTGEKLWKYETPFPPVFPHAAELDGQPGADVLLVREMDGMWGGDGEVVPEITVYALTASGQEIWKAETDTSPVEGIPADLDGDGISEAVVATQDSIVAIGAAGELWRVPTGGYAWSLVAVDIDQDGADEVIAGDALFEAGEIRAFDGDGTELWTEAIDGTIGELVRSDLDGDGTPEVLVAIGQSDTTDVDATVVALDVATDAVERRVWEVVTHTEAWTISRATLGGDDLVLLGGASTRLQAVHAATGEAAWTWTSGGFVTRVAAADLDGDGTDEVVHGDESGLVVATDSESGHQRWVVRADIGADGTVAGLDAGDIDGDGKIGVVASGWRYGAAESGFVTRIGSDGAVEWTTRGMYPYEQARLADLDGDGDQEIVVTEISRTCAVVAFDGDGERLWRQEIGSCIVASLDAGDADGDGKIEIAYGDTHWAGPWHVALLEGDGSVRWSEDLTDRESRWVGIVDGGLVHGGFHAEPEGHVTFRAATDGAVKWEYRTRALPDPEAPDMDLAGGVTDGIVAGDQLLVATYPGDVALLDTATGAEVWSKRFEAEDAPWTARHEGAALAFVPATDDTPAWFAVGESSYQRSRSTLRALNADGEPIVEVPIDGWGASATTTSFGVVIGGGLDVYGLEVTPR